MMLVNVLRVCVCREGLLRSFLAKISSASKKQTSENNEETDLSSSGTAAAIW